ncbi:MAG: nucleotidyltransferase family protein [Planctomycetes bacterium]|nr:nucleotidyltransferase family protein [Planctomycetota bacterium]
MVSALKTWLPNLARPDGVERLPGGPLRLAQLDTVFDRARWHGVLPAALANIRQAAGRFALHRVVADCAAEEDLDGPVLAWKPHLVRQTGFTLLLRARLGEIAAVLNARGIPHVVLKGPEFADRLYANSALRLFTDLDLMVPLSAADDVAETLTSVGYALNEPHGRRYAVGYGEQTWCHPDRPVEKVEVHWNLVNSPTLRRGVSVRFENLQLDGPSLHGRPTASSLLLIAAVHGATSHAFNRLQLLCDLRQAALGVAGGLDEDWLTETAARTGAALSLAAGLDLCARVFGEPLCRPLLSRLGRIIGRRYARFLLSPAMVVDPPPLTKLRRQAFRQLLKRR